MRAWSSDVWRKRKTSKAADRDFWFIKGPRAIFFQLRGPLNQVERKGWFTIKLESVLKTYTQRFAEEIALWDQDQQDRIMLTIK